VATEYPRTDITGVILAGGRASRMGGIDKGLIEINGRPMIAYVLTVLGSQVGDIVINANRSLGRYGAYGYRVVSDELSDFQGPLAGIATAMAQISTPYLLTAPCDSPLLPQDLGPRLWTALARDEAQIAVAHDGARMQPVFSLLRRELLASLREFLGQDERKIDRWYARHKVALADFRDCPDTFLNINTPQERATLAARLVKNA
jgi:molybdenum cofactor guanylyltransferase